MHVETTLLGQPAENITGDCDLTGFYIDLDSDNSSLKLYLGDEHIERLIAIFKEWGYLHAAE